MTNDEQTLSKVVPFLLAVLVCDTGAVEPSSGKKTLVGIFDRVLADKFATTRPCTLYFKITDAEGKYIFKIEYAQVSTGAKLAEATSKVLSIEDRLKTTDFILSFPPLSIPDAGQYEFRLYANDMYLGRATIIAEKRSEVKT